MRYLEKIRDGVVAPVIGEGVPGCLASAHIAREELLTLDPNDPRCGALVAEAEAWTEAADRLACRQEHRT
jgi:hypothetical protein